MRQSEIGEFQVIDAASSAYRYVRVGSFYLNTELTLLRLSRHLWTQFDQFLGSEGKVRLSPARFSRFLPADAIKAGRIARILARFLVVRSLYRWEGGEEDGEVIALDVPGDFAIVRRSGAIKVLDAASDTVYTLMSAAEADKLRERVQLSRQIAHFPFAPSIKQVQLPDGYFSEEFIRGAHPLNFEGCRDDFDDVYRPLLVQFLRALPPRWQRLDEYAQSLRNDIMADDSLLWRLQAPVRRSLLGFIDKVFERLAGSDNEMPLVLSHGDYFSGNIVIDGTRHRAIDWANMGFRSPLHDLYYLQLNHCRRVLDQESLERQLKKAIESVREVLRREDADLLGKLAPALTSSPEYRWLFYLECIHVPLLRCSNPDDRYLASMLVRVSWFEEYESAVKRGSAQGGLPGIGKTAPLKPSGAGNG